MNSIRLATSAVTLLLVVSPAGAEQRREQQERLGPPPVSPAQLRAYAGALLDTASYLQRVRAERVRCEGGVTWQARGVVPVAAKMRETCGPWKAGDTAWSRAQNWALKASWKAKGARCGEMGSPPTWWSMYCTVCPIPYDATIKMIEDDAQSLQDMASVVECLQGGAAAEEEAEQREEQAAAAKQREEEQKAQQQKRRDEEKRRRDAEQQAAAERRRLDEQRRREQAEREREAREERDRQVAEKVQRIEERQQREREAVDGYFRNAAEQGAVLSHAEVPSGTRNGEFWISGDLAVLSSQAWYALGYGLTLGLRKSWFTSCDDDKACQGWELYGRYDMASGTATDEITGASYDLSRSRFQAEGSYWWGRFAAAGLYEKGSNNDVSLSRVGPGVLVSFNHDKRDLMEAGLFLFAFNRGGFVRANMGINMFLLGVEYSWMPQDGQLSSESTFRVATGMRIPW